VSQLKARPKRLPRSKTPILIVAMCRTFDENFDIMENIKVCLFDGNATKNLYQLVP
jgi:hypothetical protein